ncbi:MAG: betaine--homocysteine S-methyltransferase [Candidatus Promineifilaceae bacterium]
MNKLQQLLEQEPYLLIDGAMGTMLFAAGLEQGDPPEEWNVRYPGRVQAIHRQYIEAGSQIILTNTFGGTRFRLKLHKMQDRVAELNRAAAEIARKAADSAPHPVIVAGSMGPTGELLNPMGTMEFEEAKAAFAEQAAALTEGGVDVLWIETMSDLNEAKAAVEGARSASDLPITVTMSFDTNGRTMMGVTAQQTLETVQSWDVFGVGGNCGNTLAETYSALHTMYSADPQVVLIAKPNAGIPRWEDSELVYDGTPEIMAEYARRMYSAGARLIGACCGSTPEHIRAMAAALKSSKPIETPVNHIPLENSNGRPLANGNQTAVKAKGRRRRTRRDRTR